MTAAHGAMFMNTQAREDSPTFPYVRTLLLFDTREFLNVLALAFEATNEGPQEGENYALPRHQTVVDIMLEIMVVEPTQKVCVGVGGWVYCVFGYCECQVWVNMWVWV